MEVLIAILAAIFTVGFIVGYGVGTRWPQPEVEEDMPMPLLGVVQPKEKRDTDA